MLLNASPINGVSINGAAEGPVTPVAPDSHIGQAAGFISGAFGIPHTGLLFGAKSVAPIARFGYPVATMYTLSVTHRTATARSLHATAFGKPTVYPVAASLADTIAPSVMFGTAVLRAVHRVQTSAPTTAFGTPGCAIAAYAHGFRPTGLGTPFSGRVQPAESVPPRARWGTASVAGLSLHLAGPVMTGVQLGAHSSHFVTRAMPLAQITRIGKPSVQRGALC